MRTLKYILAGIVLSILLTPILGIGVTVIAAILRKDRR